MNCCLTLSLLTTAKKTLQPISVKFTILQIAFNKIGFHATRKKDKNYEEDDITYHRNLLGHNDTSEEISDKTIEMFSNKLADVLLFALNH